MSNQQREQIFSDCTVRREEAATRSIGTTKQLFSVLKDNEQETAPRGQTAKKRA